MGSQTKLLLSIVIPVFNTVQYLDRCIKSIIKQSDCRFEVLLVDDGSTDGSSVLCQEYAKHDSRVRYLYQKNAGVSAARNNGLNESIGEYVWFVDSDDWVAPDSIALLLPLLEDGTADLICFPEFETNSMETVVGIIPGPSHIELASQGALQAGDYLYPHSHVFKRSVSKGLWFDTSLSLLEDRDFFYRLWLKTNGNVQVIDTPLYYYVIDRTGSATSSQSTEKVIGAYRVATHILEEEDRRGFQSSAYSSFVTFSLMALSALGRSEGLSNRFQTIRRRLAQENRQDDSLNNSQRIKKWLVLKVPRCFVFACMVNARIKEIGQ